MRDTTLLGLSEAVSLLQHLVKDVRQDTDEIRSTVGRTHIDIIRHYSQLRNAVEMIRAARKELDEIEDEMSHHLVPNSMENAGVRTVTVLGVGRVSIGHRFSCSMLDKPIGMQWLKEHGHGGLIQETVNAQTLGAFAKDLLENQGLELPKDKFKTSIQAYTQINKVANNE